MQLCTHERELKKEPRIIEIKDLKPQQPVQIKNTSHFSVRKAIINTVIAINRLLSKIMQEMDNRWKIIKTKPFKKSKNNIAVNMTLLALDDEVFSVKTSMDDWSLTTKFKNM